MSGDSGVDLGGNTADDGNIHVEPVTKPAPEPEKKGLLRSALVEGMLPSAVLDEIDNGAGAINVPWWVYLLGAGLSVGGLYAFYRVVKDIAIPVGVPLAFGGEMGASMALERLMRMSDTGHYPVPPAPGDSDEDQTPTRLAPRAAPSRRPRAVEVVQAGGPLSDDDEAPTQLAPQRVATDVQPARAGQTLLSAGVARR